MKNFSEMKLKKTDYLAIFLVGILILILAIPTGKLGKSFSKAETISMTEDESRLKAILEKMDGVGQVQVMINENNYSKSVFEENKSEIEGVVVAAEGADDPIIKSNIMEAVMALFDVEAHKIKIVKMSL